MVVDIICTIARHGPKRFYVLNTGVSTLRALAPARDSLAASGIVMRHTDILSGGKEAEARDSVDAVRDGKTWSRTGIFGDATLATKEIRGGVSARLPDYIEGFFNCFSASSTACLSSRSNPFFSSFGVFFTQTSGATP